MRACSASGHSSSAQDESERSPSAYVPRRSWPFIKALDVVDDVPPTERVVRVPLVETAPDAKGPSEALIQAHRRPQVAESSVRLSTDCSHHLATVRGPHR